MSIIDFVIVSVIVFIAPIATAFLLDVLEDAAEKRKHEKSTKNRG